MWIWSKEKVHGLWTVNYLEGEEEAEGEGGGREEEGGGEEGKEGRKDGRN